MICRCILYLYIIAIGKGIEFVDVYHSICLLFLLVSTFYDCFLSL